VNQPIMKLNGKNIIGVCMLAFYENSFFSEYYEYKISQFKNAHNSITNIVMVKYWECYRI